MRSLDPGLAAVASFYDWGEGMAVNLYFPYDGSPHGRWVFRYALRMAFQIPGHTIHVVHAHTADISNADISIARKQLEQEASATGMTVNWTTVTPTTDVYDALAAAIPDSRDTLVVCGTRSAARHTRYLSGSVCERFLTRGQRQVVVIRVNNPGLLGFPQHVLVPFVDRPGQLRNSVPVVRLLAPDIVSIHVLLVQKPKRPLRTSSPQYVATSASHGLAFLERIETELTTFLPTSDVTIDGAVRTASDFATEVIEYANRVHARLILLGATRRSWWNRRFCNDPLELILRRANCDVAIYRDFP